MSTNHLKYTFIILFILVLATGVFVVQKGLTKQPVITPNTQEATNTLPEQPGVAGELQNQQAPEVITSNIDTSDWLTYHNEEYGFEIRYPGWTKISADPYGMGLEKASKLWFGDLFIFVLDNNNASKQALYSLFGKEQIEGLKNNEVLFGKVSQPIEMVDTTQSNITLDEESALAVVGFDKKYLMVYKITSNTNQKYFNLEENTVIKGIKINNNIKVGFE